MTKHTRQNCKQSGGSPDASNKANFEQLQPPARGGDWALTHLADSPLQISITGGYDVAFVLKDES